MFVCLLPETVARQAAASEGCHSSMGKIDEAPTIKTKNRSFDLLLRLFRYYLTTKSRFEIHSEGLCWNIIASPA